MTERNLSSFNEPRFRPDGAFSVVETTARGLVAGALIVVFEVSTVGEKIQVPGAKTVRRRLEPILYTPKQRQKKSESEAPSSKS